MSLQDGYDGKGRTGDLIWDDTTLAYVAKPAASDTVTFYTTLFWPSLAARVAGAPFQAQLRGYRYKMAIFTIFCTNSSAALGYQVDASLDAGVTWDNIQSTTIAAATFTRVYTKIEVPEFRIRFVNSAAVQTAFRWSLTLDTDERGNA
jgi:hypothetical protein